MTPGDVRKNINAVDGNDRGKDYSHRCCFFNLDDSGEQPRQEPNDGTPFGDTR